MTPKWPQNDVKMEPFEWEIITRCYVISVYGGTAKAGHKWSAKKMARVPPMQITFFRYKTAAQYPASQRGVSKNWREFRLCKRLFFGVHRLHSTQQMRKLSKRNGEHSVHTNDCFAQCFGHIVHSERESCLEKNYESSVHVGCAVCSWLKNLAKKMARAPSMRIVIFPTCDGRHYDSSVSVNENIKHKWSGDGVGGMA